MLSEDEGKRSIRNSKRRKCFNIRYKRFTFVQPTPTNCRFRYQNLLVIETNDAILVADKSKSQDVKKIVSLLEKNGFSQSKVHQKVYRPWGYYISIEKNSRWQIKKIIVNPGAKLSLQMHHHRSEHWIVVNGTAEVELGIKKSILSENESIYIPLGKT